MLKTFQVNLDIEKDLYSPSILAFSISQNDFDTVEITFSISQDEAILDLTGTTVQLAVKKPSGLTVYQDCTITNAAIGEAKLNLNNQAFVEYGIYTAEVYVRAGEDLAVTCPFWYMSRAAIFNDDTLESENDWTALQQALLLYDKKPVLTDSVPTFAPEYVGQTAIDTVGKRAFISYDITADSWQVLGAGEGGGGGLVAWTDILGKPATFPPSAHIHTIADVTGLQADLDLKLEAGDIPPPEPVEWIDVQNKPTTFAPAAHTHTIADVSGLQAALDGKADDGDLVPYITEAEADVKYALKGEAGGGTTAAAWGDITGTLANQTDLQAALNAKLTQTAADARYQQIGTDTAPTWTEITGKPTTFAPSAHTHAIADVTGLQAALDAKADDTDLTAKANTADVYSKTQTYSKAELYNKTEIDQMTMGGGGGSPVIVEDNLASTSATNALSANQGRILNEGKADLIHTHVWADITDKPTTFTPSAHTHLWADITDKPTTFTPAAHTHLWADITDKPTTFAPSAHTHTAAQITDFATAVAANIPAAYLTQTEGDAAYQPKGTYLTTVAWTDVTGKPTTFTPSAHTHLWADITDKPTTFTPAAHTHTIADVTNLQSSLDAKAPIASPTFTGTPAAPTPATADNTTKIATTAFVKAQGYLTAAPVASVAGKTGAVTLTSADVGLGNVTNESKATMFTDAALTGTPTAPTAATATNTTQIATTAFVKAQGYLTTAPVTSVNTKTGAVTVTATDVGLGNVTNESKATMFTSPAFTGTPTAPTAAAKTNTTQVASTAFVNTQMGGTTIWTGTQAAYDAIGTKDGATLYFISG